ncbi:MAG TPA: dihydropteroate synthase [Ilumatobacteraceae bacterium]|nr:dihydropteroate synthase [Ilumatobacteraceae bacterium]
MELFAVLNASPDSLNTDSIVTTVDQALARAAMMLAQGADALDLGGQGSTDVAEVIGWRDEWARLEPLVPALAALGVPLSVDTWRPQVARRALEAGATVMNAADGMQTDEMWQVAADFGVPIVVPFLSGPNPREMAHVTADPIEALIEFFEARLADADRFGVRGNCIIDPGTGFAPSNWPWEERYLYQKIVYSNLDALRRWDLPLYIALPWKDTPQHWELMEIVLSQRPEYGRCHYPDQVRAVERRLGLDAPGV